MIFRKKMPRSCCYCEFGTQISENEILCVKKKVVPIFKACRKFRYEPCKRIPLKAKAPDFTKYSKEDFTL